MAPAVCSRFALNTPVSRISTFSQTNYAVLDTPINIRFFTTIPNTMGMAEKSKEQRKFSALSPDVIKMLREELEVSIDFDLYLSNGDAVIR